MKCCALLRLPIMRRSAVTTGAVVSMATPLALSSSTTSVAITTSIRQKGDFAGNVFHNSNPQHGGAYDQAERRMRDDEVEDFLLSVKGWDHNPRTDAIKKTFKFPNFDQSYQFMGRLFAFSWALDKYTPITWHGSNITVELYSAHFKGLSKREAKIAAFCNDQYNMLKKGQDQSAKLQEAARNSMAEKILGESVREEQAARNRTLLNPSPEALSGTAPKMQYTNDRSNASPQQ